MHGALRSSSRGPWLAIAKIVLFVVVFFVAFFVESSSAEWAATQTRGEESIDRSSESSASAAVSVEFWVVEPNEGRSSGGHAAIRIGDWTYHVEHRGDGLIADRRTPRARFEEIYRLRDNRGIQAIPVALTPAETTALQQELDARYFERKRELDGLDALTTEAIWLSNGVEHGSLALEIPGLGLYAAKGGAGCAGAARARGRELQTRLEERYGPEWLDDRLRSARERTRTRLEHRLEELSNAAGTAPPLAEKGRRAFGASFGHGGAKRRLIESAQLAAAFELLVECRPLRAEHLQLTGATEEFDRDTAPEPDRIDRWRRLRAQLFTRFLDLVASERDDVGLAIMLTSARLEALDRSISAGRLSVLDPFRIEPGPHPSLSANLPENWKSAIARRSHEDWRRALVEFESGRGPLEARLAQLERTHHAYQHVREDTLHRRHDATRPEAATPTLSASAATRFASAEWPLPWPAHQPYSVISLAHEVTARRVEGLRRSIQQDLGYRLFTQNCVTELLPLLTTRSVDRASDTEPGRNTSHPVLTGRFVPAIAGHFVERELASGPAYSMPSARTTALAGIGGVRARLRESNTLTSDLYRTHAADSSFLFFSDGPIWTRPLAGVANLAVGIAASGVGIITSPFDRGQRLRRGVQGIAMSVPELFLLEIRRGTYVEALEFDSVPELDGVLRNEFVDRPLEGRFSSLVQ